MRGLNYSLAVLDEIALEGLDGITFPTLIIRLEERFGHGGMGGSASLRLLWNIARTNEEIEIKQLPQPRPNLVPHDRYLRPEQCFRSASVETSSCSRV